LQHPGIAPVYELGQFADERPFFSMKLVKGETLAKLLAERENVAEDRGRFIGIFEHVCQTMAYAHSRGVIQAQTDFEADDGGLARHYLDECRLKLRGWEHRYLWMRIDAKQTLVGHTGSVTSVAFIGMSQHLPDRGWAAARHLGGERGAKPGTPTLTGPCALRAHPPMLASWNLSVTRIATRSAAADTDKKSKRRHSNHSFRAVIPDLSALAISPDRRHRRPPPHRTMGASSASRFFSNRALMSAAIKN
jgi:hypothetical protein